MSFSQNLVVTKPRPGAHWFILWIVLVAVAIWLALPMVRPDATIPVDGKVHQVDVNAAGYAGDSVLWFRKGSSPPTCAVRNRDIRAGIGLQAPAKDFERGFGNGVHWLAAYQLDPGKGHLAIRCSGSVADVQIGPVPRFSSLAFGSPQGLVGIVVGGLLAVICLIGTAFRAAGRPGRRRR